MFLDRHLGDGTANDLIQLDGKAYNVVFGVGSVRFADGTASTRAQLTGASTVGSAGADAIYGTSASEVLDGLGAPAGAGDYLRGGGGNDTYLFREGYGRLTINNTVPGGTQAQGELAFGPGIAQQNLWFAQSGTDLVVSVLGSTDSVTVSGWFTNDPSAQLAEIKGHDGLTIDSQVGQLVAAMTAYQTSTPGFDPTIAVAVPNDPALQAALTSA